MSYQVITLSIIPNGEIPVFYTSQYETGRPLIIDLVDVDGEPYTPNEGVEIELHERKVDDNIVILSDPDIDENRITFTINEQVTACSGDNVTELWLIDENDNTIGTLNFIIHVEKNPISGGVESQSVIDNISEQINEMVTNAVEEIAPDIIEDISSDIVTDLCEDYNERYGGRWQTIGQIRQYQGAYIAQNVISGLTNNSFVEIWTTNPDIYVKEITINNNFIIVEFEPDESMLVSPPMAYIHFYNVIP